MLTDTQLQFAMDQFFSASQATENKKENVLFLLETAVKTVTGRVDDAAVVQLATALTIEL